MPATSTPIWSRQVNIDWPRVGQWISLNRVPIVLYLGVFLRVFVYLRGRTYWMDEGALLSNLTRTGIFDFSRPLAQDQLAPFGFIIIERALVRLFGDSTYVTRLIPLLCGTAALLLFARIVRLIFQPRGALVAITLFSLSYDLIYYASELKPYSLDLLVSTAVILAALECVPGPVSSGKLAVLVSIAVLAPWFSFSSAFVIAGCGLALLVASFRAARYRETLLQGLVAVLWLASFALSYFASRRMLVEATTMYVFWDFAFIPILSAPMRPDAWNQSAGILVETLVNPLNLIFPPLAIPSAIFVVLLVLLGAVSLCERSRTVALMLLSPVLLAVAASALRRYPFHGRLTLELIPACFIVLAAATEQIARLDHSGRKRAYKLVLLTLLAHPVGSAVFDSLTARDRDFNSHGDLHDNLFVK